MWFISGDLEKIRPGALQKLWVTLGPNSLTGKWVGKYEWNEARTRQPCAFAFLYAVDLVNITGK